MQHDQILNDLELAIAENRTDRPTPMPGDRWILASALQKAIRRGETERARMAAAALWQQDRQSFWRRLHIIALEDLGAASPDVIVKVLTATSSSVWRRRVGDERVGLFLVGLMCGAVKNRMADELFIQAQSPEYSGLRERLIKADDGALADCAVQEDHSLIERALSLWLLTGTKKFPSDVLPERKGSPDSAVEVLQSLNTPVGLVDACVSVMGRTSWPLSIYMPLIWQEVQKQPRPLYIFHDPIPTAPAVEDIPVYACDMFTRTGQTCFRQLQKAVPELRQFSVKQIGLGVFYSEGRRLDKVLTSDFLEEFKKAGEIADIEGAGLHLAEYMGLKDCLMQNMTLLDDIRQRQLRRYLEGGAE